MSTHSHVCLPIINETPSPAYWSMDFRILFNVGDNYVGIFLLFLQLSLRFHGESLLLSDHLIFEMKAKETVQILYQKVDDKVLEQFGFKIKDVTFNKMTDYMYSLKDSSSLAVTRILFGLAMLFDIPDERGGAVMDKRWGDPNICHFPLFPFLRSVGMPYMAVVYAALWLGALGIMLGYKYRLSAPLFTACHWYLVLIEKSFWNNHSYLFGLVALLLCFTQAECYWSLDAYLDPNKKKLSVPYWNYFLLKYQFFILYFMAGMKKGTAEWLAGYSVLNISEHWVFAPFKYFLTVAQTDYLVVHCFVFVFDLTVAVWMMWSYTRHVAMLFCAMFHFMNSRLFRIGMFPWVCLATMPLFYPFDWPKTMMSLLKQYYTKLKKYICKKVKESKMIPTFRNTSNLEDENKVKSAEVLDKISAIDKETEMSEKNTKLDDETDVGDETQDPADKLNGHEDEKKAVNITTDVHNDVKDDKYKKKRRTMYWIALYVFVQAFLPYSHFITKGYNNWTDGLYGYSWDMMVHTWDVRSVIIKVVDNENNKELYIDPQRHAPNDRWSRHGDMIYQYAQCLKSIINPAIALKANSPLKVSSKNISIYFDIWCSLNGRFVQRMFDSKVDILKASWSPFREVPYLMHLVDGAVDWRSKLDEIRNDVHSWSENSDVVFYADFPGYEQEKFIPIELRNVTLTVLEGKLVYEIPGTKQKIGQSFLLTKGCRHPVESGKFHKVTNIEEQPVFYMYNFYNSSEFNLNQDHSFSQPKLPIFKELTRRFNNMIVFSNLVGKNLFQLLQYKQCSL